MSTLAVCVRAWLNRHTPLLPAIVAGSLMAAGCGAPSSQLTFNAIDITGAEFARDFKLNAADGSVRTLDDFRGKVVLLLFGFTQCPDVCPTALARAADVKRQLGKDGDSLQALFVTVDPERDLPVVLKAYTSAFDPTFIGLSADLDTTKKTADAFRIYYAKVPTGASYTMDHTAITYAYDTKGALRLAIRHSETAEQLTSDIRQLLQPQ